MAEQLLQRKHCPNSASVSYWLLCVLYPPIFSHLKSTQIDAKEVRTLFAQVCTQDSFQVSMLLPSFVFFFFFLFMVFIDRNGLTP